MRNPSQAVRALYLSPERAPHVFLSGRAAEDIAGDLGAVRESPEYFFTAARWREHRRGLGLPEEPLPYPDDSGAPEINLDQMPTGTVGAVIASSGHRDRFRQRASIVSKCLFVYALTRFSISNFGATSKSCTG